MSGIEVRCSDVGCPAPVIGRRIPPADARVRVAAHRAIHHPVTGWIGLQCDTRGCPAPVIGRVPVADAKDAVAAHFFTHHVVRPSVKDGQRW
jgi:hypothetical protein